MCLVWIALRVLWVPDIGGDILLMPQESVQDQRKDRLQANLDAGLTFSNTFLASIRSRNNCLD